MSGRDAFRWHFGPMFYRGRLTDGAVRVLVIGQEGAQDESLGHRSFVGGSGARMQHFLRHLGITRSYLFLNTFVYPIFGQYDGADLLWLAQNPASPLVTHRHAIFDYLVQRNDLRLIVAVGKAAKESVHTWITSRGGACPAGIHDISACAATAIAPRTRVVGVVHPGAGGKGGSTAAIIANFKLALGKIEAWATADPSWLPVDPEGERGSADSFSYRSAPIPFRDLPYGVSWRIGQGGTSSNRKDSQRGIQMFSEDGEYGASVPYPSDAEGSSEGFAAEAGDLPYEPPKKAFAEFDPGPGDALARLMMGGEPGLAWPDFNALGVRSHASFGISSLYRGRPAQARVLVLIDQESHDDLFLFRAATGGAGQRFQEFLRAMGITNSYLILRVLPVDTLGLPAATVRAIVDNAQVRQLYRTIVERVVAAGNTSLTLCVGSNARRLRAHVMPEGLPCVEMKAWAESGSLADWKRTLRKLAGTTYSRDLRSPGFAYDGNRSQIPRIDLPYGTLRWQGGSGDRGVRSTRGTNSHDYYKVLMPRWAFDLPPAPLSDREQSAIEDAPEAVNARHPD